ncbi:hypothetical protein FIA58_007345 [Flavobacterium jejuense]|uniref:Uncharacterized protein n=1 Tax=Flavobacterium jejuense TaxID=1544455 RepID=A0ABX0IPK3_9FLAO|nr:hypothetical protein [Flavobacterium jejuense]NHN25488.1 hypothetical protein [Flavobacterium jejuense]
MPKAANVLPEDLMNNMMGKIFDIITNGDGTTVPKSEDNFFAWTSPGVPFDIEDFDFLSQGFTGVCKPQMITNPDGTQSTEPMDENKRLALEAQDSTKMYQQAEQFARFVDVIPDASGIDDTKVRMNIKNDEGTLSDVYEETLRFSQVANTELTAAEKAKIERFRQLLQVEREKEDLITGEMVKVIEESPLVKLYNEKMQAWMEAALEYNSARIDALTASTPRAVHNWAINANVLRAKVKFSYNDWVNNGYKNEFEGIAARIDQMSSRDLSLLKALYKDTLEKSRITGISSGADFFYTSLAPANFAKSKGWTRFTFTNNDYSSYSKKTTKKWGASGGLSLGFFTIGGSAGGQKTEFDAKCDFSSFKMSFEICQVPIVYPWLKKNFLTSKTWRFAQGNEGFKSKFLSDGKKPPHRDSMLPAIPTAMIFIRNLKIEFANASSVAHALDSKIGGGGMVGYGPFFIGGSYESGSSEKSRQHHSDSQGIYVDGLQCVGFKCHLLPKSPNPDPAIKSWV